MNTTTQPTATAIAEHAPTPWTDEEYRIYGERIISEFVRRKYANRLEVMIHEMEEIICEYVYRAENTENEEVCDYFSRGAGKALHLKARAALSLASQPTAKQS